MKKIRNEKGKWLNSSVFREEAIKFQKNKTYTSAPWGTPDWMEYWETHLERCISGYSVFEEDGTEHKITGHHYAYLNFTEIQIVEQGDDEESAAAEKITQSPDFWDGDYDYFWSLEIARYGLFTKNTQVPSTPEEKRQWNELNKKLRLLKKELKGNTKGHKEYHEIKEQRDNISLQVLDRLKLKVKPHLDYLDGGYHMIVGKSRRKGYSYKNGAICANVYNTQRKAQVIIGAFEKKFLYPQGTMGMASNYLNFLNTHTGWAKSRDETDKIDHKKSSYKTTVNGITSKKT